MTKELLQQLEEHKNAHYEIIKALDDNLAFDDVGSQQDVISNALGYVGNYVLDGLNSAYKNFKKYNMNLLQVTNKTSFYTGSLCFRSGRVDDGYAKVNVIAPLPLYIPQGKTVDAVYEKGIADSKNKGLAYQWIGLTAKDNSESYTVFIEMNLVSAFTSDEPSLKIKFYKDDIRKPIDEIDVFPNDLTPLRKIEGSPFGIASTVSIGSSEIIIVELQD